MKLHHILVVVGLCLLTPAFAQEGGIDDALGQAASVVGFVSLCFGLIFGFFGLRIFKIMVFIIGFVIGFIVGAVILGAATENAGLGLLGGLLVGIGGGYLALFLRLVIHFLFGFALGACGALGLTIALYGEGVFYDSSASGTLVGLVLVLGIIGGIVSVWIADLIVILSTAALGASLSTIGIACMAPQLLYNRGVLVLIEIAMFALGVYFQYHKREHWKQYSAHHTTTVNTNVSNNNTIEILMPTIAPQEQFAHPPQSYPSGQYMQPGYPVTAGFPQPVYAQPGYPQPGYPQSGFPQPVYPVEQQLQQPVHQGPVVVV